MVIHSFTSAFARKYQLQYQQMIRFNWTKHWRGNHLMEAKFLQIYRNSMPTDYERQQGIHSYQQTPFRIEGNEEQYHFDSQLYTFIDLWFQ